MLFEEVNRKFNPQNLNVKIIQSERIHVEFQEFRKVLSYLNDKKSQGVDGLPVCALRKISYVEAYKYFSQWVSLQLNEETNNIVSTARLVFLSKTKSEIAKSHKDYRCLAV